MKVDLERLREKAARTRAPVSRTGILERNSDSEDLIEMHAKKVAEESHKVRLEYLNANVIKFPNVRFLTIVENGKELTEALTEFHREGRRNILRVPSSPGYTALYERINPNYRD